MPAQITSTDVASGFGGMVLTIFGRLQTDQIFEIAIYAIVGGLLGAFFKKAGEDAYVWLKSRSRK